MDAEKRVAADKKRQEKEYFVKMLAENAENQKIKQKKREKERLEDIRMQEEYARMLDQQEADRKREREAREKRQQEFMNRMADGVLKEMDQAQK